MASVTQRIPHYLGGVSKQSDIKKFPGQVRECLNAYPEPTFGLMKRPGFEFLHSLDQSTDGTDFSGTALDNAKWFYINRDDDETYIGCIISGAIHIWNGKANNSGQYVKCTVGTSENGNSGYNPLDYLDTTRDNYDVLTVQDTTYITNKTKAVEPKPVPATNTLGKKGTIRIRGVDYSAEYSVTIKETGGSDQNYTFTTRDVDNFTGASDPGSVKLNSDTILTALETGINNLSLHTSFTVTRLKATLELSSDVAFTLTCQGGASNEFLACFQDQVEDVSKLPEESAPGRIVKIINTESKEDTYYAEFKPEVADTEGAGYWEETRAQDVETGIDAKTMPHELQNTAVNVFNFQPIEYTDRLVGDDTTNEHPSFIVKDATGNYIGKIQQAFFHNNRLGFLTSDNVSMSQSGQFKNFYHESARVLTSADPVDLSCSSIRPAVLHGVTPTTQGLILFSATSQYIMYADNGVLTPTTTVIRQLCNYEIDNKIAPVDNGLSVTFLSKTPGYSRVFSMETRGQENNPNVLDIAKTVTEYIPDTITSMIASPQNDLIALYGVTLPDVYFYKSYHDGEKLVLQAWFKWKLPGNVLHLTIDNDTMWAVIKYVDASSGNNRYHLLKTSLTQTPENPILTTKDGQSINPYMDMYATASSVTYDTSGDFSKCYLPYIDVANATPVLILKGDASAGEVAGFTLSPERSSDGTGPYFKVPNKDWTATGENVASKVVVGYKYDYDITLPKTYYQMAENVYDYTSVLTIARMKFSVGLSSVAGFKVKRRGRHTPYHEWTGVGTTFSSTLVANGTSGGPVGDHTVKNIAIASGVSGTSGSGTGMTVNVTMSGGVATAVTVHTEGTGYADTDTITIDKAELGGTAADVTATITKVGQTAFPFNFDYTDVNDLKVKVNGVETTAYTIADKVLTMTSIPADGHKVLLYTDTWYDIQTVKDANEYLTDDVPLAEQSLFTLPIHDKTDNFSVRVFSDSPFPISLTSMMWEGNYSPRYYRRT